MREAHANSNLNLHISQPRIIQNSKIKKYYAWYKIRKYLIDNNFSKVIFNSAERNILKLIYFLPTKIECIGTIHNANKLIKKDYQKKISKRLKKGQEF